MEAAGGEGMQVDGGASNPGDRMYEGVRSIFYYNTEVQPGQSVGLHLFEPRYRVLVKRAVEEPARNRELIFLPNFKDYIGASGDLGVIAHVERYIPIPSDSGDPDELPRAEVQLKFGERVMILWHWVEPATKGLHECTFRRIPLLPSPHALEPLRDAMHTSAVSRYTVRTQRGFLNVHSSPSSPDDTENIVGRLEEADQIVALEHRPGWVRHERGWSVARVRLDNWLWLVPEHPQVLAPDADLMESSRNTNYSHLVMHTPSNAADEAARRAYEQVAPGSSTHVLRMKVPSVAETVCLSILLERLAAAYLQNALPPLCEGSGGGGAQALEELSASELQAKLEAQGIDASVIGPKVGDQEALLSVAKARLALDSQPWSRAVDAADVAAKLLQGTEVAVACGAPCGLEIQAVEFARCNAEQPQYDATLPRIPLAATKPEDEWGGSTWFEHFNRVELSAYMRSQYEYEQEVLQQCPYCDDEVPMDSVIAHAASIRLTAPDDPQTLAIIPPNYALVDRLAADALVLRLLKRLNWCRFRLCFLGQRQAGCVFALLEPEVMRLVLQQVLREEGEGA